METSVRGDPRAPRPALEVADVFRDHGTAYRRDHAGHLSRDQLRVMGAIGACRTATLGGHVERCGACGHERVAYNSCRNRHCPKCQGGAAVRWLEERQADLLAVPYFHVVFTLPASIAAIAYHNKAVLYDILFKAAAESLRTIAADPKHLGAGIGITAVLHTWGQTLQHHPHVHCIVPGGGIAPACPGQRSGGERWIACRPGFFLPVRVLSRLYRRLFVQYLQTAFDAGQLRFFSELEVLSRPEAFATCLKEARNTEWVVYAKRPFAGPGQVLAYLSRYTHRVAIANSRLTTLDDGRVGFSWKDYRHHGKSKVMTLEADEFIRRFLLHVLPDGFHRIRHYGFLANGHRAAKLALCRNLIEIATSEGTEVSCDKDEPLCQPGIRPSDACPCCGGTMVRGETLPRPDRHHRIKRLDSS